MEASDNPSTDAVARAARLRVSKITRLCELTNRSNAELRDWSQRVLHGAQEAVRHKAEEGEALIREQVAAIVLNATPRCIALALGWRENRLEQLAAENEATMRAAWSRVLGMEAYWRELSDGVVAATVSWRYGAEGAQEPQLAFEEMERLKLELEVMSEFLREPLEAVGEPG